MIIYFTIFIIICLPVFFNFKQLNLVKTIISLILIITALLSSHYSKDYSNTIGMYREATAGIMKHEFSFYFLARVLDSVFKNPFVLLLLYSALGVSIKVYAITRLTEFIFPSLLIYFSYYFFLHEVTQIRAGVSSALVLLSIAFLSEQKNYKFFAFAFLASIFHYSAIVIFPLILIKRDTVQRIYYFLIPAGFLIWALNINLSALLSVINIEYIRIKYQTYLQLSDVHRIHLVNVLSVSRFIFCYILLWKWRFLKGKANFSVVLIKLYVLSSFVFIIFSDIPALAFRLSEFLGIVEIILIPYLYYLLKDRLLGKVIVTSASLAFLALVLFYERLIIFN